VEGRIGDQAHLKFILDTGASISIVGPKMAQKLKLKLNAPPAQGFNFDRNLQWETATIPEIQFGPIQAANVAVLVGDLTRYSEFAGKADAIIGMDLLRLNNFTIDYGAAHLIFDPPRTYLAGGDPMTKCLIVELQVQDRPVHLIVDTGLQVIVLYEERLRRSVPGLRTSGSIKSASMGGRLPARLATLPDVVIGNKNHELPVVLLPAPQEDMLHGIDGVVGVAALQARRVHFDFSNRTITWE
jgi:predicted aspartyl protease